MKPLTIIFYISLILIIAKCNKSSSSSSVEIKPENGQILSGETIYNMDDLVLDGEQSLLPDSANSSFVVSIMKSKDSKDLDFLLGTRYPFFR